MLTLDRSRLQHYGFAAVVVMLAWTGVRLLDSWLEMTQTPFLLFLGAVILSARYGGFGPGVLATVLSVLLSDYGFLLSPMHPSLSPSEELRLLLFALEGLLISQVCRELGQTQRKLGMSLRSLQVSEARYRQLVDNTHEGIWVLDPNGRTESVNQRLALWLGYSPADLLNRSFFDFLDETTQPQVIAQLQVQLQCSSGTGTSCELCCHRHNNVPLWVWLSTHPIRDEWGTRTGTLLLLSDISDRKQAEAALAQVETRFAKLVKNLPGVIYQFRHFPDGRFELPYISPGCQKLYGIDAPTLQAQPVLAWEAIHPEDMEAFQRSFSLEVPTGEQWKYEWRIILPSRQIKWLKGVARAELQSDGCVVWDGLLLDITERKQAEQERESLLLREQEIREAAQAANRIKDEFLAVLSHELRTPLNPILGWIQMLRNHKLDPPTASRALKIIERNTRLQIQLIDDLLDVSQILRGKLKLKVGPVNLETTIQAALETIHLAAGAKAIELKFLVLEPETGKFQDRPVLSESLDGEDESEAPEPTRDRPPRDSSPRSRNFTVLGDPGRLQQVVWHLLSNAIKFTPNWGRVEICLEQIDSQAQIRVTDTGIGIESEFLPQMFNYFRQADSTTTRKFGGLGLGLAIARHITELHGGVIAAASPGEGQGTTVLVRLPLLQMNWADSTRWGDRAKPMLSQSRSSVAQEDWLLEARQGEAQQENLHRAE